MNINDAELIEQLQLSQVPAFDGLYWKYHEAVYRNIFKFVKEETVAQDILQEVFSRLWEKRYDLKPDQPVSGWLFVISFNLSVSHIRKRVREYALQKDLMAMTDDVAAGTDNLQIQEAQYKLLMEGIEQLSPRRKTIITKCKLEGKTYAEVAEELNISRHTVKEHLSAAMSILNDYMQRNGEQRYVLLLLFFLNLPDQF
ncbi:RNA polymerase, sigma subunit, ECF family [Chitinophaga jiangningensis]|uniref:RNA polymerase, sigma subunit, ECF family n=1 Tax=Chitinophaga jiangningensis TaxID=1419482 RepID=A0A1M7N376_9BACT|nr:sigma-70 family RNA polymerase sigma factor [Chitinophaga jiangningensis]SHM97979.1 RNA polymerase, sigma subunit, ECF family [Chitinophaga jiangningensis]